MLNLQQTKSGFVWLLYKKFITPLKLIGIIIYIFRFVAFALLAVLLLVLGAVITLYSPWLQEELRMKLVERVNIVPGMSMTLESFDLDFPLDLSLGGLSIVNRGDTLIAASNLEASVALLPLLGGEASADHILLEDGRFRLGEPDSAMFMTIAADVVDLAPVSVGLKDMSIDIAAGRLGGATVAMVLSPDTVDAQAQTAEPTEMSIRIGDLALDSLTYRMKMLPTIDSLSAVIGEANLRGGLIDLKNQRIELGCFAGRRLDAAYIAPDSTEVAAVPVADIAPDTIAASAPWTIEIDTISFADSHALYTTKGLVPVPGLDFGYIEVDSLDLNVHHFYNQATTLRLPLTLHGVERCGVALDVAGTFALDSTAMYLDSLTVTTPVTTLSANALMGMGDLAANPDLPLSLYSSGAVGIADLRKMFPAFLPYLMTLPANGRVYVDADIDGSMRRLDVHRLDVLVNGCMALKAKGYAANLNDSRNLAGNIVLRGDVINVNKLKDKFITTAGAMALNIPRMRVDGNVRMSRGTIAGKVNVLTGSGSIALDGRWNSRGEDYNTTLDIRDFPVATFMPNLGASNVTASLTASGHGYNPFGTKMKADARLDVVSAEYGKYTYRDISAVATIADGKARVSVNSVDPDAKVQLMAEGNLDGDKYDWTLIADGDEVDLYALKFSELETSLSFNLSGRAVIETKPNRIDASLTVNEFDFKQPTSHIDLSDILTKLDSDDSTTVVSVHNRDFTAAFRSPTSLDSLMAYFGRTSAELDSQLAARVINIERLHQALPPFNLGVNAGSNNAINDVLASSKTGFRKLTLDANNDSTLRVNSRLLGLVSGTTHIDTITFDARQHGEYMGFNARIGNRPGTFDAWARVNLDGYIAHNEVGARFSQHNISGKQGFDVGLKADVVDSVATLRLVPVNQVIGYKPWTVNKDNFISYVIPTKHIDANLIMTSDKSKVEILTEHVDSARVQEDLVVRLSDINISDWVSINPFAPPVKGALNADIRLRQVGKDLNGVGNVSLDNFFYGKERVATMKIDFDVITKPGGLLYANSNVFVDGKKTMTLAGNLNDSTSTSPYNLDFSMIHFPLTTVNPFLPANVARLRGTLNGTMRISGESDAPVFNGYIDFDSTAVKLSMTGTDYVFSDVQIPVVDNLVDFNNFTIKGVNDNPLRVNGSVDISSLSSPKIDLTLKADNMQLVNSRRASKGADVYGKAFIGLDSRIHGDMNLLFVNADLRILPPTNVTYMMSDAANAIASQSTGDMVKFVTFTDTAAIVFADSIMQSSMAMVLDAELTIENGTTIGVDLSSDGKNRVQLEMDGTVDYTISPLSSEGRMTGRLNINSGYGRYSPPFMSEKNFAFDNNSYVAFNGDVLDPTLNIHATDVIKANVTQTGQNSRLVNFDVMLNVTGTLNRMDVSFDLSTGDDVTVANELQSMSADQRANQAMNMLLYGIYTGPGTKGDASISGNALYSFLESQINSWAANNIKGVDLSFGINQYDKTVNGSNSQTTSYSYQVSKSLFNDRFKIVIGGNYSTDANADENFSQNLINDISFEYFLNRGHTMYIRIFRHTGYESILEGEITQTGVGFVYRRKLNKLGDMFKFLKPKRKSNESDGNKK